MAKVALDGAENLKAGEMKKFSVSRKDILVANIDGTLYAMDNTCTHMGGSLADGELHGYTVKCPRHGAEYDIRTGECTGDLTLFFIKKKTGGVVTYPVILEDGNAMVEV